MSSEKNQAAAGAAPASDVPAAQPAASTAGSKPHALFPGRRFISTVLDVLDSKTTMSTRMRGIYLQRAAMAGFFVGFFYMAYFAVYTAFAAFGEVGALAGRVAGPLVFGWALVLIYYTNSELLTSNMMVISIGWYHKRIRVSRAAKLLGLCFLGNLLGALVIAVILRFSTVISPEILAQMTAAAQHKMAFVEGGAAGVADLIVRAMLCNFCINIAMLMVYNGKISDDFTKCAIMLVAVFVFAFCGFEHSIANSALFLLVGLQQGIDVLPALASIAVTLVGNLIGGGVLIGLNFAIMNDEASRD